LLFVQDPSILWSATLNVTAMPNVWRRTNPLLPLVVTLYSKLLNAGQVFLSLIVIVFVPFVTDEFGSLESILEMKVLGPMFAENKSQLRLLASVRNLISNWYGIPRGLKLFRINSFHFPNKIMCVN
jgi:hypothetical protein